MRTFLIKRIMCGFLTGQLWSRYGVFRPDHVDPNRLVLVTSTRTYASALTFVLNRAALLNRQGHTVEVIDRIAGTCERSPAFGN